MGVWNLLLQLLLGDHARQLPLPCQESQTRQAPQPTITKTTSLPRNMHRLTVPPASTKSTAAWLLIYKTPPWPPADHKPNSNKKKKDFSIHQQKPRFPWQPHSASSVVLLVLIRWHPKETTIVVQENQATLKL
ncbi:hypothetical protein V6N13_092579 [Hibiscus sabdariffa]